MLYLNLIATCGTQKKCVSKNNQRILYKEMITSMYLIRHETLPSKISAKIGDII